MLNSILWFIGMTLLLVIAGSAAWAGWRAAPYLPTRRADVDRMLRLAHVEPGQLVVDLGAGDGRLVIAAAQLGARATGYEISLIPYLIARWRIRRYRHLAATMIGRDFFTANLSSADVVVCFLTPPAMKKLAAKFLNELRPGTRIVSYAFPIAGWQAVRRDKPEASSMGVYLYTMPPTLEH